MISQAGAQRAETPLCLEDAPDWQYLLQEFDRCYRLVSAGGSHPIDDHLGEVQHHIANALRQPPHFLPARPARLPVTAHLKRALDNARQTATGTFARAVDTVADELEWSHGYSNMPAHLRRSYGYTEILGPNAPIRYDNLILGLVLFAPRCTYPSHRHGGITESYICISGAMSENDEGVFPPGSLIYNRAGVEHRITTAEREPVLLAYAWTGEASRLQRPEMVLTDR